MKIFVANLHSQTSRETLWHAFETFGDVESATVILDKATGRSKGFGFVDMPNDSEAHGAIDGLNGQEIDGREIVVKRAR